MIYIMYWLSHFTTESEWTLMNYLHIFTQQNPSWAVTTYSRKSPPFTSCITALSVPCCKMCSIFHPSWFDNPQVLWEKVQNRSSALIPYAIKAIILTLLLSKLSFITLSQIPSGIHIRAKQQGKLHFFIFLSWRF